LGLTIRFFRIIQKRIWHAIWSCSIHVQFPSNVYHVVIIQVRAFIRQSYDSSVS
jgi:hypothetical protein